MSQYKAYPAYKDSGVEWIGQVPEHWEIPALKFLVSTPITDGPHETPVPADPQDGVLFISAEAVSSGNINFSKAWGYISQADHKRYARKYKPQKDDIYMVKSGATTGVTAIVEDIREFNIWSPLAAIRANSETIPKFLLYALRSTEFQAGVVLNWSYGTQQNIGMNVLENLPLPTPPQKEQAAIAATLDHETARIEALVKKKTRFIELLKEKRQALITHAVTKGLDPNVKMMDSGVEWIGQVPEHWEIPALKFLVSTPITDGPHETPVPADPQDGVLFISAEAVSSGNINFSKAWGYISQADHKRYARKYKPQKDDIYMVKSGATTGVTAIVEDIREFNIWSPLAAIRANSETIPKFLLYALRSTEFQAGVVLNWSYGTQQNIGMNVLENLPLPTPPQKEQAAIAATLDHETARIDALVAKAEQSITLLKERRAAFITAAVTGQIDLRGEQ